jgi:hypothetical protein
MSKPFLYPDHIPLVMDLKPGEHITLYLLKVTGISPYTVFRNYVKSIINSCNRDKVLVRTMGMRTSYKYALPPNSMYIHVTIQKTLLTPEKRVIYEY